MGDLVKDADNTKEQLVHELSELRSQNATSLQSSPQYVEVPPNIEAKRIISYLSALLSY
jgi:hypothetical protein